MGSIAQFCWCGTCTGNLHAALWTRAVLSPFSPFPGAVFFHVHAGCIGAFFSFACAVLGACDGFEMEAPELGFVSSTLICVF